MITELMYLALNPNLTAAEHLEASRRIIEGHAALVQQALANAKQLPANSRLQYLIAVMPLICR